MNSPSAQKIERAVCSSLSCTSSRTLDLHTRQEGAVGFLQELHMLKTSLIHRHQNETFSHHFLSGR